MSKACDYIRELRQNNQQLQESYKEVERVEMDNELLRQQVHGTHHNYVATVSLTVFRGHSCDPAPQLTATVRTYTNNLANGNKTYSTNWLLISGGSFILVSYMCPGAGQDVDACRANKVPLALSLLYDYCISLRSRS